MPPNKGADLSEARSHRRVATQPRKPSLQRTVETMELASMDSARAGEFVELLKAWYPEHHDGRTSPIKSASRWLGEAVGGCVKARGLHISVVSLSSSPAALVFWTPCSRTSSRSGGHSMLLVRRTLGKPRKRTGNGRLSLLAFLADAHAKGFGTATVEGSQCTHKLWGFYESVGFRGHCKGPQSSMVLELSAGAVRGLKRVHDAREPGHTEKRRLSL